MWPKDWRLLLIAPLSAIFLTACPDGGRTNRGDGLLGGRANQQNSDSVSRFAGGWINSELDSLNKQLGGDAFCAKLSEDYAFYGIAQQESRSPFPTIDAWLVTATGEVLLYNPAELKIPFRRRMLLKGNIDAAGNFVRGSNRQAPFRAYNGQTIDSPFYYQNFSVSQVVREGETLIVYSGNELPRTYVRLNGPEELTKVHKKISVCLSVQRRGYTAAPYPNNTPNYDNGYDGRYGQPPPPQAEEYVEETYRRNGQSRRAVGPVAPGLIGPPMPGEGG